jgi:hypothetical protein
MCGKEGEREMLTRKNFKEEFIDLVEKGKSQIDDTVEKAIKEYSENYVAHYGVPALKEFFDPLWIEREKEMIKFVKENFWVEDEQEFIDEIKSEYGLCEDFYNSDVPEYLDEILDKHFEGKKIEDTGWDGRIL